MITLLRVGPRRLWPYVQENNQWIPIRGFNKKGHAVWRSYKTEEEAADNLQSEVQTRSILS